MLIDYSREMEGAQVPPDYDEQLSEYYEREEELAAHLTRMLELQEIKDNGRAP